MLMLNGNLHLTLADQLCRLGNLNEQLLSACNSDIRAIDLHNA